MTSRQLETLQLMARSLTWDAYMYGGPYSYYCYRNLLMMGYVEKCPGLSDWVQITKKGREAVEVYNKSQ